MKSQDNTLTLFVNDSPIYNRLIKNKTTQIEHLTLIVNYNTIYNRLIKNKTAPR